MEEWNEKRSPPPQVNPEWYVDKIHRPGGWPLSGHRFQDAHGVLFQTTRADDLRLDFYRVYRREATKYDEDYAKRHHEDLNAILVFVHCIVFTLVIQSNFPP